MLQPDVAKDSSTEATCLMKALDVASNILSDRGMELPEHLVVEALVGRLGLTIDYFLHGSNLPVKKINFIKPCLADRQLRQGGEEPVHGKSISIRCDHPTVLDLISKFNAFLKKHHKTINKSAKSLESIFPSKQGNPAS